MKKSLLPIGLLIVIVAVVSVVAKEKVEMNHNQHNMNHSQHAGHSKQMPTELGQAGFAAIAEIVSLLSNDPATDWTKVDINGLREHLLFMNQLVSGAIVKEQTITGGRRFTVTGTGTVLEAIQQMVPAHAVELNKMSEFNTAAAPIDQGVILDVVGKDSATNAKVKGLGFFGLMALGSHHQRHHLMMALGNGHH